MKKQVLIAILCSLSVVLTAQAAQKPSDNLTADRNLNVFTVVPDGYRLSGPIPYPLRRVPLAIKKFINRASQGKPLRATRLIISHPGRGVKKIVNVYRGVQSVPSERIVIISRGRNPALEQLQWLQWFGHWPSTAAGIRKINQLLLHDILPEAVFVIFDYSDPLAPADFGYAVEQKSLEAVIRSVKLHNPHARITLVGDCRGAHAALCYVAAHPDDKIVDSLILESPYAQIDELIRQVSSAYVISHAQPLVETIFHWYYPAYRGSRHQQLQQDIPAFLASIVGKKIFIGHSLNDRIISQNQIDVLIKGLSEQNELYFFSSLDKASGHVRLSPVVSYRQTLNAFCARYGLSHDAQLATAGGQLLEGARVAS